MILYVVALYLVAGMGILILFDALTHRIRKKLEVAAYETHETLITAGHFVKPKTAKVIFFGAMWIFWPAVLVGALTDLGGKKKNGKKEKTAPGESSEEERPA